VIQDPWNSETIDLLLKSLPIDLILLDLMLRHGNSGYDIFDQLKLRLQLAQIRVVAVSASDALKGIAKTREKGFLGYIAKPIRLNNFPGQIEAILTGEDIWDAG
jgi:CheY-like chemotaxis protein